MIDKVYDQPSEVAAKGGNVAVDGPDGVDILLTPEAAEETGHRLVDGAVHAQGQRIQQRLNQSRKCAETDGSA